MNSKSKNMEVMTYDDLNKIIEERFELLLSRYQISLETNVKESCFIFDYVTNMAVHISILRT